MSRERIALIAIGLLLVAVYFAFTKHIPFTHGYRVNAYVRNANNMKPGNPVRIAGINVGKVAYVTRDKGSPNSKIVMDLKQSALPLHTDATLQIRPRILLEGNYFIDLKPGSPSAPTIKAGGSIPLAQTATAVQFDQVLSMVNSDFRHGFKIALKEFAGALYTLPTPAEDARQDPIARGKSAFQALNASLHYAPQAIRGGAHIFKALAGEEPDDVPNILRGLRDFSEAFNQRELETVSYLQTFDATLGAFTANEQALADATSAFSRTTIAGAPTAKRVKDLLPYVTSFSNNLAKNIGTLPATISAANPWITQTTALLDPDELGITSQLSKEVIRNFAGVVGSAPDAIMQIGRIAACWNGVVYPTLLQKVADGALSTGKENYKEFWYSLVGLASESQSNDANGALFRLGAGGANPAAIASRNKKVGTLQGTGASAQQGIRPSLPKSNPPISAKTPCYKNPVPDVNALAK